MDWPTTWIMITAIGTAIMSLAIIITAAITLVSWNKSKTEKNEKYLLDRQSLSCGILSELNSNENLMKYLKDCKIVIKEVGAIFSQPSSGKDFKLNYNVIISEYVNNFEIIAFDNFKKSGISYKDLGMIFELTFIYKKINIIKKLLNFILNKMNSENSKILGENNIQFATKRLEEIREDIDKALAKINDVYEMFKDETNFDFINSKYYRKFEPLVLS